MQICTSDMTGFTGVVETSDAGRSGFCSRYKCVNAVARLGCLQKLYLFVFEGSMMVLTQNSAQLMALIRDFI